MSSSEQSKPPLQEQPATTTSTSRKQLKCDYLVVGMGTACLSFVDTLLTENQAARVVLVDRRSKAGGHWTTAYPFVRLHQPSCNYGVNSIKLSQNRDKHGNELFDCHDRVYGPTIVEYYDKVVKQFLQSKRVEILFDTEYKKLDEGEHILTTTSISGGTSTTSTATVQCTKLVTCISELLVPSMRNGPLFPVHEYVNVKPPNALPNEIDTTKNNKKYIILGAGKTSTDSICYLIDQGVEAKNITWVISRDVWFFMRDGAWPSNGKKWYKDTKEFIKPVLSPEVKSIKDLFLAFEKQGIIGRLNPDGPYPEVFKGAAIDNQELAKLRSIQSVVRLGRVTSISEDTINLERGSVPIRDSNDNGDTLFVDCMADNFYGYNGTNIHDRFLTFEPGHIKLGPTPLVFNPSATSALVAYIETNFYDDDIKNQFLYFARGEKENQTKPRLFMMAFYCQLKTFEALSKHGPAMEFVLKSRTNPDAPEHHGGLLKLLWAAFGPIGLDRLGKQVTQKVENGGFEDVSDCFGWSDHREPLKKIPKSAVIPKKKKNITTTGEDDIISVGLSYPPPNEEEVGVSCGCKGQ